MCGRYTLRDPSGHRWLDATIVTGLPPRYNVAPSQTVPVIGRDRDGAWVTRLARWGFRPRWLPVDRKAPINARIESAPDKPLFRAACARGRCLVPADGWFEWQAVERGPKQPYFFHRDDDGVFFFAGLGARDADDRPTLAILTTDADAEAARVHPRMPAVLGGDDRARAWLEAAEAGEALAAARAGPPALRIDPVSRHVNRPEHDDPGCVRPVDAGGNDGADRA